MKSYCYCGVQIKGIEAVYSFISDAGALPIDSFVIVPFGKDNAERVGRVVSCGEYTEEDAPYPVERTKHILRTATQEEYNNEVIPQSIPWSDEDASDVIREADELLAAEDWEELFQWAASHHHTRNREIMQKVIDCYRICLKQGMPEASLNLGTLYYVGNYLPQDFKKAFELYKIAADAGNIRAICNCGYCFYYGRHEPVNFPEAYRYFTLGAILDDDANCLYKLGDMYLNGYAVSKNEAYAFKLFCRARNRCDDWDGGDCQADVLLRLGACYLRGVGTEVNAEKAHRLLSDALCELYERRKTDPFARKLVGRAKELLKEAEEALEGEAW